MPSQEPEVGDQVSWQYGGSAPGGEVAEKKSEGEVAVQSKRGNTIKKAAKPDDPAIHLARPGNDVVKNQSELQVEEKASSTDKKDEPAGDDDNNNDMKKNGEASTGEKRKAEDEAEGDGETVKKARGRPKGALSSAKPTPKSTPAKKEQKEKATPKKTEKAEKPQKTSAPTNGEKKPRGRPKGSGNGAPKAKKEKKAAAPATGIGKRTRAGGNK